MRFLLVFFSMAITLSACQTNHRPTTPLINEVNDPIERMRMAYQVDRLQQAKTIRLEWDIRQDYPDHDYSPDFHDMSAQRAHHIIDLQNKSGSSEYLTRISNSYYHGRSVFMGNQSRFIVYPSSQYQNAETTDFVTEYGPTIRSSGVMLALWLSQSANTARLEGEKMWLGKLHDKVTFDFPNSPPLSVLIEKNTGYINKMTRTVGNSTLVSYTFDYHRLQDGIPVAQEHSIYGGRERIFFSFNRNVILDDNGDQGAFEIEPDIIPEPERVDQSTMTVEPIGDHMYQVGQGEAYTSFIKTSIGLVVFGVEADFQARLQAYRATTGDQSSLRFAIIPNHHNVRMAGASEAVAAGAKLLITPGAQTRVLAMLEGVDSNRIETIPSRKTIDALIIYNIPTSTASENLVVYDQTNRAVIQSSHYSAPFTKAPLFPEFTSFTFLQGITPLGISPDLIISTDSRRVESWETFENAVAEFINVPCARNRRICEGWE